MLVLRHRNDLPNKEIKIEKGVEYIMMITAEMVKELRALTGAGMMDCKESTVRDGRGTKKRQ